MFILTKEVFIVLLSFRSSLARTKFSNRTKFMYLNNKSCVIRSTVINFNPVDVKYYPFMIR